MIIKKQDNIRALLADITIPNMVHLRQHFPTSRIDDVAGTLYEKLRAPGLEGRIRPGMRVVLTGSSRGIAKHSTNATLP